MRTINLIVVHCSATQEDRALTAKALDAAHRRRGFKSTGYHYYIRRDGSVVNRNNVRICGHRDLSPDRNGNGSVEPAEWIKLCPCFDVTTQL